MEKRFYCQETANVFLDHIKAKYGARQFYVSLHPSCAYYVLLSHVTRRMYERADLSIGIAWTSDDEQKLSSEELDARV